MHDRTNISNLNGSSLVGFITKASFEDLVSDLGGPCIFHHSRTEKTNIQWNLSTPKGPIAIYDWKRWGNVGNETEPYDWHVAAHSREALDHLRDILPHFIVEA